jgi:hypothetical protein
MKWYSYKGPILTIALCIIAFAAFKLYKGYKGEEAPTEELREMVSPLMGQLGIMGDNQRKVIICWYEIRAVEELTDTTIYKAGNFEIVDIDIDRYWQTKTFKHPLPTKWPEDIDLVNVVPPENDRAKVVAIASVEKLGRCRVYDFTSK